MKRKKVKQVCSLVRGRNMHADHFHHKDFFIYLFIIRNSTTSHTWIAYNLEMICGQDSLIIILRRDNIYFFLLLHICISSLRFLFIHFQCSCSAVKFVFFLYVHKSDRCRHIVSGVVWVCLNFRMNMWMALICFSLFLDLCLAVWYDIDIVLLLLYCMVCIYGLYVFLHLCFLFHVYSAYAPWACTHARPYKRNAHSRERIQSYVHFIITCWSKHIYYSFFFLL